MKRKIIAVLLAVVLVAGGLGAFAYAQGTHEPMAGQKLVGMGGSSVDGDIYFEGILTFTNPDGVSEITIEQISIIKDDGTVVYEDSLIVKVGDDEWRVYTGPLKPHETLQTGLEYYDLPELTQELEMMYTVEIFWSGSHQQGLPLIGWSIIVLLELEVGGNVIIGPVSGWSTEMVNMEQKLKP